ncbi:leucine-rich repeat domain-containing protein [Achromobacter marplatensis]|uniref:hypothetical protein n=1 Tax=Achromobacter marplatensis TaxID=470868 RepID=UPI0039F65096
MNISPSSSQNPAIRTADPVTEEDRLKQKTLENLVIVKKIMHELAHQDPMMWETSQTVSKDWKRQVNNVDRPTRLRIDLQDLANYTNSGRKQLELFVPHTGWGTQTGASPLLQLPPGLTSLTLHYQDATGPSSQATMLESIVTQCPGLIELVICGPRHGSALENTSKSLDCLQQLTRLKSLALGNVARDTDRLPALPQLKELALYSNQSLIEGALVESISRQVNLEALVLKAEQLDLTLLGTNLNALTNLTRLMLGTDILGSEENPEQRISDLPALPNLERFSLFVMNTFALNYSQDDLTAIPNKFPQLSRLHTQALWEPEHFEQWFMNDLRTLTAAMPELRVRDEATAYLAGNPARLAQYKREILNSEIPTMYKNW